MTIKMTQQEQMDAWINSRWRVSRRGSVYKDIGGHHVGVMRDHRNPEEWVYELDNDFRPAKFSSERDAKAAAVDEIAAMLFGCLESHSPEQRR